jgi:hypothetical protein
MKVAQAIMRFVAPACEVQRMEFREGLARAAAHAENLTRTLESKSVVEALRTGTFRLKDLVA